MRIDPSTLTEEELHNLLKGCVVPRPIAWVSTISSLNIVNLAPFSCFTFVATKPPMIALSIARRGANKKDTLINMEHTGDFVINIATDDLAEKINRTSEELPPDVSEVIEAGLTSVDAELVRAPRISECPIHLECRVATIIPLGESQHSLVLGEVVLFSVADNLFRNGEVDSPLLRPLARLNGEYFGKLGEILYLPRKTAKS